MSGLRPATEYAEHDVCAHLHPEGKRRCQLFAGHDEIAHSWERSDIEGEIVESYEWTDEFAVEPRSVGGST